MNDPVWFVDVSTLWKRPMEFFPSRDQTPNERLNSLVRLVAYCAVALVVYKAHATSTFVHTPLVVGAVCIAGLSLLYVPQETFSGGGAACAMPTQKNPFQNKLYGDSADQPRPCGYKDSPETVLKVQETLERVAPDVANDRQFMTAAVPDKIPDTKAFRDFVFGKATPTCKESTEFCRPYEIRAGRPR